MFSSDLSDEHVLHLRRKYELTERVLEPLEMSDTEILRWMSEYSFILKEEAGIWHLSYGINDVEYGTSIETAVRKAAAKWEASNRDF